MDAERRHLVKQVFPKVRAACMARQVGFTEIDLRWGVTEEEAKNGATVEICLREIDRCRDFPPFFIGFLGERYGWIPRHDDLVTYWDKHSDTDYERTIRNAVHRNISVTELEMELAVLTDGAGQKLHDQALFLLRASALTDELYRQETGKAPNRADTRYFDDGEGRLSALKARIRATPFVGIDGYTSIVQFGQSIEDYLLTQLDRLFPENDVPSPLERQRDAHAAFRFHRLQNFLPRLDMRSHLLASIERHIAVPYLGPILVSGPSGQGKSALMADLAQHLERVRPNWLVLDHYTGADDANNLESWVRRIMETLHPSIAHLVEGIPETPKGQKEALCSWISMTCREREQDGGRPSESSKLILILDAIDQNSDGGKHLDQLKPEILGPDAVLVTSAADGTPACESAITFEKIFVPPLTAALKVQIVTDTLARFKKKLPATLVNRLASAKQSGSPLFLGLALEELRLDARHETLHSLIDDILNTGSAQELFLKHFLLDEDNGRSELPTLAAPFMALLGASRAGLKEIEVADLLASHNDPIASDTKKPRLPQVHLSRLLINLSPFLLNKNGRRAPMHQIFGTAALEYYGTTPVREHLYRHFRNGFGNGKQPFLAYAAGEALFQMTKLANVRENRKRLKNDVGNLPAMAQLIDADPGVVADAFAQFSFKEMSALGVLWGNQVTTDRIRPLERTIDKFADWICDRIGHYPAAQAIDHRLLEQRRSLLGDEHQITLASMTSLSYTLKFQGKLAEARALLESVCAIQRRLLGEESYRTQLSMTRLAHVLENQGDFSEAVTLRKLVLTATRKRLGDEHAMTLDSMSNLADTLHACNNLTEANSLRHSILDTHLRRFGESHTGTLHAMGELALSLCGSNALSEARALQERTVAGLNQLVGFEHQETLGRKIELSKTLVRMGDFSGACDLQAFVMAAQSRYLHQEHPLLTELMQTLATTYCDLNQSDEASSIRSDIMNRLLRAYGEPWWIQVLMNLNRPGFREDHLV